jgi:hypothetical protein
MLRAFEDGADLMFSPVSAAEVIGTERQYSVDALGTFLDAVGPYWFPIEGADLAGVLEREAVGASHSDACTSRWFIEQYFASRNIQLNGEQRLGMVGADFFRLGFVFDWLHRHRADIHRRLHNFEDQLRSKLQRLRQAYEKDRNAFDIVMPPPHYDASRPATFAWEGLIRLLVLEARSYQFKPGDGADLCHAIMGSAFANFTTLDKHWKRRILALPQPNGLARVYYAPELDELTADVEAALRSC